MQVLASIPYKDFTGKRDHSFSIYAEFLEKLTFLTPGHAHVHVHIRG